MSEGENEWGRSENDSLPTETAIELEEEKVSLYNEAPKT